MGTGIFAVAMAAFGIAVDDTIHLVVRFRHEFKEAPGQPFSETLRKVFARELFPLLATSTTLILGFSVLLLSDFQMHRETGLLFMVAISAAMVADLFLTPLILKRLHCWECDRCAADAVSSLPS
jgi:predicted RND superfamily exporter protein